MTTWTVQCPLCGTFAQCDGYTDGLRWMRAHEVLCPQRPPGGSHKTYGETPGGDQ